MAFSFYLLKRDSSVCVVLRAMAVEIGIIKFVITCSVNNKEQGLNYRTSVEESPL